jgi:hypothetical protein
MNAYLESIDTIYPLLERIHFDLFYCAHVSTTNDNWAVCTRLFEDLPNVSEIMCDATRKLCETYGPVPDTTTLVINSNIDLDATASAIRDHALKQDFTNKSNVSGVINTIISNNISVAIFRDFSPDQYKLPPSMPDVFDLITQFAYFRDNFLAHLTRRHHNLSWRNELAIFTKDFEKFQKHARQFHQTCKIWSDNQLQ